MRKNMAQVQAALEEMMEAMHRSSEGEGLVHLCVQQLGTLESLIGQAANIGDLLDDNEILKIVRRHLGTAIVEISSEINRVMEEEGL